MLRFALHGDGTLFPGTSIALRYMGLPSGSLVAVDRWVRRGMIDEISSYEGEFANLRDF
jgi:hypothetical protein